MVLYEFTGITVHDFFASYFVEIFEGISAAFFSALAVVHATFFIPYNKRQLCASIFILLSLIYILIGYQFIDYYDIKKLISSNELNVVEGKVSNLKTDTVNVGYESFNVDDQTFKYNMFTLIGYSEKATDDGVIKNNGQNVRITYYNAGHFWTGNVIIKIEEVDDENNY
jgi:hypothetical protein